MSLRTLLLIVGLTLGNQIVMYKVGYNSGVSETINHLPNKIECETTVPTTDDSFQIIYVSEYDISEFKKILTEKYIAEM